MKPKDEDDSPFCITVCGSPSERDADAVRKAVARALRVCARTTACITIQVVDDEQIALLNERHLGHSGPTDCLTFNYGQPAAQSASETRAGDRLASDAPVSGAAAGGTPVGDAWAGDSAELIEGEIVISLDTARREADARGHAVVAELMLYAIHGTLHLLGYDDGAARQAREMHALEDRLLVEMGVGPVFSCRQGETGGAA